MVKKNYDNIQLKIFDTRTQMGQHAAEDAAECITSLLAQKEEINCIFAAAPSQSDFLTALLEKDLPWHRINAYHMDEYVGFALGYKDSFNHFLSKNIFDRVPFKSVHLINGANDPDAEVARYGALLDAAPTDITFMGIGENGHIAFNDPSVADFADVAPIKKVALEDSCRQQQVNDGCFPTFDDVPEYALTVTIPRLTASAHIFCIVPTAKKSNAVKNTLMGDISEACPASILRKTPHVKMYIDTECAADLLG